MSFCDGRTGPKEGRRETARGQAGRSNPTRGFYNRVINVSVEKAHAGEGVAGDVFHAGAVGQREAKCAGFPSAPCVRPSNLCQ